MSAVDDYRSLKAIIRFSPAVTTEDVAVMREGVALLQGKADAAIAELEARIDGLYAEVKMYGAANGELKDALHAAEVEVARLNHICDRLAAAGHRGDE